MYSNLSWAGSWRGFMIWVFFVFFLHIAYCNIATPPSTKITIKKCKDLTFCRNYLRNLVSPPSPQKRSTNIFLSVASVIFFSFFYSNYTLKKIFFFFTLKCKVKVWDSFTAYVVVGGQCLFLLLPVRRRACS